MSGPEHQPPDDHELEDFLAGRGPHRARYHSASQEQAPASLDAAVLAQAQAAVAATPAVRRLGASRWRLPLSLAATLVLGLGLSTRVLRETPVLPAAAPAPVAAETAADAPAARVVEEVAAGAAVVAPPAMAVVADAVAPDAAAKARVAESRAQAAAEQERRDRELAKAERQVQQAMAAAAPEVMAAPPAPPPPPPPAPALAMKPQAPEADAPGASAGLLMPNAAPSPAPPVAAMAAPAPRAEFQAKRRAAVAALAALLTGRYRAESGAELELFADGRFTLSLPAVATLAGHRQREAGGERLLPDAGVELSCALWLQSPATEEPGGAVHLRADCESRYAGLYRREAAGP